MTRTKSIFVFFTLLLCLHTAIGQPVPGIKEQKLRFIDDIEIIKGEIKTTETSVNNVVVDLGSLNIKPVPAAVTSPSAIESANSLQIKYALMMDTEVEKLNNNPLYVFVEKWMGTPYKYGSHSESGTDCSGFSGNLHRSIFNVNLPRTAREQYKICKKLNQEELCEGDLVFFNTRRGVSHVGVYLHNGFFVHASTKEGVRINNLKDDYYNGRFIGGGRPSFSN